MDGIAFDIQSLLLRCNLDVSKCSRRDRRTVKMHPLIIGVNGCGYAQMFCLS